MNDMVIGGDRLTMSSREIAELTGKNHKDVMRDIRVMLRQLETDSAQFCAQYKDSTGRKLACFDLPKRETLILVSGYNVQMRAKIIDRWQELEAKEQAQAHKVPSTLSEALPDFADPVAAARARAVPCLACWRYRPSRLSPCKPSKSPNRSHPSSRQSTRLASAFECPATR